MRAPILFYCQHSLGMGHLMRSLALTRALARSFDVTFLSGGELPTDVAGDLDAEIVELPPLGMNEHGAIVSRQGTRSVEHAFEERRRVLLTTFRRVRPRAIIIELFPFGRRKFASELLPLLEEARGCASPRTVVLSSVRDILVGKGDRQYEHDCRAIETARKYFDGVLVHCDPRLATLEESLAPGLRVPIPVHYTGFVHHRPDASVRRLQPGSIVVSAGGGRVGGELLSTALDAQLLLPAASRRRLTLLTGPCLSDASFDELVARARGVEDVQVLRSVPCLSAELERAAASISQCGYNTAMDLLRTRVPALVVPYGEGDEDEQRRRARRLASMGALKMIEPAEVSTRRLAEEMAALTSFVPSKVQIDMDGANHTAALVERFIRQSGALPSSAGLVRTAEARI